MQIIETESKQHWLELRAMDITSTEASALLGLSPYMTEFELWHNKKEGRIVEIDATEVMRWGYRLEAPIAKGIGEDQSWKVWPFKQYGRLPELRAGSSFDFMAKTPEGLAILEIKNVSYLQFRDKWLIEDGEVIEAPPHIEIQVQHQMMVSGIETAYIGALVGGNKVSIIKRKRSEAVISKIRNSIENFWKSIDANNPPKPNMQRDSDFIISLLNFAEPGTTVEPNEKMDALAARYQELKEQEKKISSEVKAIKADMLSIMGDAEKCRGETYSVSAGMVAGGPVSYERKPYRNFKISFKKEK
jgi:putative phage-type endonuclease